MSLSDAKVLLPQEDFFLPLKSGVYLPGMGMDHSFAVNGGILVSNAWIDFSSDELRSKLDSEGKTLPSWYYQIHKKLVLKEGSPFSSASEWFSDLQTGIFERTMASPQESELLMGILSVSELVSLLNLAPNNSDGLIFSSSTLISLEEGTFPDYCHQRELDFVGSKVARLSGCQFLEAFHNGCAGALTGISRAIEYLASDKQLHSVFITCAERLQNMIDLSDPITAPLFGDGATSLYLSRSPSPGKNIRILGILVHLDNSPSSQEMLCISDKDLPGRKKGYVFMNGRRVFAKAVSSLGDAVVDLCNTLDIWPGRVKMVLSHQANARIVESVRDNFYEKYGTETKFPVRMRGGNISSATIGRLVSDLDKEGRFKYLEKGDLVAFTSFGMGLYTASVLGEIISE